MMKLNTLGKTLALLSLAASSAGAFAAAITPSYDSFGLLPVTYGGSGIPNDPSAITNVRNPADSSVIDVTLGMIATQRSSNNPPLTNNGAGTYTAVSGAFTPFPGGDSNYARWNFDYYIGGANAANYTYKLFYDMDPGVGTDISTMGFINLPAGQNSWNLGMNFLAADISGLLDAPDFANFDPNVVGEYGFALVAYSGDTEVGRSAILVNVPEPGSIALVGVALLGLGAASRRTRRAK